MKSLKAKFKKADVSAIPSDMGTQGRGDLPWDDPSFTGTWGPAPGCPRFHRDMGTCPGMSQVSQGCGDMGIFPRMSPVSQGCGNLPWDMGWLLTMGIAAPRRLVLPPWPVRSSSQCTQGCSQGHR